MSEVFDSMSRVFLTNQVLRPRTAQVARHQFEDDLKKAARVLHVSLEMVVSLRFFHGGRSPINSNVYYSCEFEEV